MKQRTMSLLLTLMLVLIGLYCSSNETAKENDMEFILTRYRIVPGKLDIFKTAIQKHFSEKADVEEALRNAGIALESAFIDENPNGDSYFYVFKKVADNRKVLAALQSPKTAADQSAVGVIAKCLDSRQDFPAIATFDLERH